MRNKSMRARRCVCYHHHHNATYNAFSSTLLLAEVIASLLRSLYGQMRQVQTNIPWQNTCYTRLAHTQHPNCLRIQKGVWGLKDHSNQWLHCATEARITWDLTTNNSIIRTAKGYFFLDKSKFLQSQYALRFGSVWEQGW